MNKFLSNKYNSYQGIVSLLTTRRPEYETYPRFVEQADQFMGIVNEITYLNDNTNKDYRDLTGSKDEAKERMAVFVSSFAAAGALYALETGQHELKAELEVTYSEVKYVKDSEAMKIAKDVESLLLASKDQLAEYFVTESDFQALNDAIEAFNSLYRTRAEKSDEAKVDTRRLEVLFRRADELLREKLDRSVKRLRIEVPDFHDYYFSARSIVDL